ncbi:MAG: acyl-CoA dehydrogenase family protein [Acidobacteriota bacterium]
MTVSGTSILTADLLTRCHERAATYDRENRFFQEDFDELKAAGYLKLTVPPEFGGAGFTFEQYAREARTLAYHAPATALALNMHHYWVGLAADLHRMGDHSVDWILEEAAHGEVFAAGHGETGVDINVLHSTTKAERVSGGYTFTGRKSFGSLSPVWTRLGLHGIDMSDPSAPKIVHAFLPRDSKGYRIHETWDVLGMRATKSDDTILEGAFVPDKYVARVIPEGVGGADMFVVCIFAWALLGFGNVYYGVAQRARDVLLENLKDKRSIVLTRPMIYHAEVQHGVADMVLELEAIGAHLDHIAHEWSTGVNHGMAWPLKIISAKYHAVEAAWRVVDRAMDLSGGFGMFKKSELERLFRDARAGRFQPANTNRTHELVAKMTLGINPDEQPRWG